MTWLGHHEFGEDHRPFIFDENDTKESGATNDADYWLKIWINCYSSLLEQARSGKVKVVFSGYEQLCDNPARYQAGLFDILGIGATHGSDVPIKPSLTTEVVVKEQLLAERARGIHAELIAISQSNFN